MTRYTRFAKDAPTGEEVVPRVSNRFSRAGSAAEIAPEPNESGDVAQTPTTKARNRPQAKSGSVAIITLFLITLMIPIQVFLGSLQLTPNRLVLLALIIPLLVKWANGEAGKIYGLDFVFIGYVVWMGLTLFIAHGTKVIDLVGITFVETVGAFLIGRVFVRTPEDFERVLNVLFYIMLLLVPAAVLESFTGIRIYSEIADAIGKTHPWVFLEGGSEKRMGLFRAHTVFEHPILFGAFSASIFGLLYYGRGKSDDRPAGIRRAFLSLAGTFFSLSSGAIISMAAQIAMVIWDKIMRKVPRHWLIMLGLVIAAFTAVNLASNRTPFQVFITYASFNSHNGYIRIAIFNYGMENVWANPIFGLGQGGWDRPSWLAASVDNFWLLMAIRHGFPGFLLIAGAFLGTIIRLSGLKIADPRVRSMRYGIVFALIGLSLSLMTVHVWGVTYVFICFLLGTGVWMRDYAASEADEPVAENNATNQPTENIRGRPAKPK